MSCREEDYQEFVPAIIVHVFHKKHIQRMPEELKVGPKGHQQEVGTQEASRLLVIYNSVESPIMDIEVHKDPA